MSIRVRDKCCLVGSTSARTCAHIIPWNSARRIIVLCYMVLAHPLYHTTHDIKEVIFYIVHTPNVLKETGLTVFQKNINLCGWKSRKQGCSTRQRYESTTKRRKNVQRKLMYTQIIKYPSYVRGFEHIDVSNFNPT